MTIEQAPPGKLWHYTSGRGLQGIAGDACIWASNALFLNDEAELTFGLRASIDHVRAVGATRLGETVARELLAQLEELADDDLTLMPDQYVCSFSTQPDSLSQWRGYTRPGDAYAVGIDKAFLDERILTDMMWMLEPCVYGADAIRIATDRIIQVTADLGAYHAVTLLLRFLPTFKHQAFADEHEWRLIIFDREAMPVAFHESSSGVLVPHVEVRLRNNIEQMPFKVDVMIGPGPSQDRSARSVRAFLASRERKGDVTVSSVPYRTW